MTTALAPAAWGMTYIVTTELLPPGRPLLAGALRALPAGFVLAAFTRRLPRGIWWAKALVLGTLNIGGFFALLFMAAYRLPGGVAATLGAVQPLVAAGLAAWLLGEGRPVSLLAFTSWQLVAGGLVLVPAALAVEGLPPHLTGHNLLGFLWLATAGTAVAYSLWFRGIERIPVSQASLLALMSPVVATAAGWLIAHQTLELPQIVGAALVLAAVWLGQRSRVTLPRG